MWRKANKAVAGIAVLVAAVPLAMIAAEADGRGGDVIRVPPVGDAAPPGVPVTDVAAVGTDPGVQGQSPSTSADSPVAGQAAPGRTTPGQASAGQASAGQLPREKSVTGPPAQGTTQSRTSNAQPPAQPPAPNPPPPPGPAPSGGPRIVCPDPRPAIPFVPAGAQAEVAMELRYLDAQLTEANRRLVEAQGTSDPNFVRNAILGPLTSRRVASLDRIAIAIGRFGPRPTGLDRFAQCDLR
ncbi:hypothetical protein JOF56_006297 [Kibdelosporangium banguiense]|uniref:Uncharacterized protein n=1 Tax=Kibdelosporangium banguiense TaxID=1365924 RepID=A0ABS4TND3_9PSEU|nr:hypothetical protein [Kibdelosporangium banguiense]MBP2325912.1 hypothetical protein [Kibdelosporangium banguiense]